MRNRRIGLAILVGLGLAASLPGMPAFAQASNSVMQTTAFGFYQPSVPLSRGTFYAVVDVDVSFTFRTDVPDNQYPDMRDVVKAVLGFLREYPDKTRYWEFMAREGAAKFLNDNPAFASLTMKLVIQPDDQRSYIRTAVSTATR